MINREVIYDRNLTGSYMKVPVCVGYEFDEKMMLRKKLPGLLSVEKCFYDGVGQYWYNISGKQSLDIFCRMQSIGIEFVEQMIISICSEIEIMEWNLWNPNCLILDPEQIFISNQNQEIIFATYPGNYESISNGFQQLIEFLLTKIDHKDVEAVHLGYGIYEKTLNEAYNLMDIRNEIIERKNAKAKEKIKGNEKCENDNEQRGYLNKEINGNSTEEEDRITIAFKEMRKIFKEWQNTLFSYLPERKNKENIPQIIYPEGEVQEERITIHPTVCLGEYRIHPEGRLLYQGSENLSDVQLMAETSRVGKEDECEICITKETISRFHARIDQKEKDFYIEDLNSTNGTFVNDELLPYKKIRQLKRNDIIRFADVQYRFL